MARVVWLTMSEVLEELGVARSTMDDWRRSGRAPKFVKLPNGELRLRRDDFEAWTERLVTA